MEAMPFQQIQLNGRTQMEMVMATMCWETIPTSSPKIQMNGLILTVMALAITQILMMTMISYQMLMT